ncbi:helix-turn-helix transcriptional regulator [Coralliovum pocilloporae]|uniref:helix-turn-helix transcriptional regulator n=1 Tax=Coralliovum pocilloporae TaxID=3066369 RepID=UPI003306AB69
MLDSITELPRRQILFAVFLLFVFATSIHEIVSEFAAGETLSEMFDDIGRLSLGVAVFLMLAYEYRAQRKAVHRLKEQLIGFKSGLSRLEPKTVKIGNQYRAVMQHQFDVWQLTESEQNVVIMLLKGLSFQEIAQLRNTREKTVRQQASSVYRKAGVTGRNELAAWFFEDLLDPQQD